MQLLGQGRFLARAGPLALGRLHRFGAGTASWHQRAIADHAVRLRFNDAVVGLAACLSIVGLDQHPLLFLACQAGAEQVPHAAQLLSLQAKAQLALGIGLVCVTLWLPDATVPDDHIAGAIVTLRDTAFEIGVVERVILYVHRQASHLGVQGGPFGDGPAFQRTVQFQTEVVMQVAGVVLLNAELQGMATFGTAALATGLGCGIEVALALIFLQGLGHHLRLPGARSLIWEAAGRAVVQKNRLHAGGKKTLNFPGPLTVDRTHP
ncbi:hypothetical protein D3C78_611620 [compost metagenome]